MGRGARRGCLHALQTRGPLQRGGGRAVCGKNSQPRKFGRCGGTVSGVHGSRTGPQCTSEAQRFGHGGVATDALAPRPCEASAMRRLFIILGCFLAVALIAIVLLPWWLA